jgi:hypothetical protein
MKRVRSILLGAALLLGLNFGVVAATAPAVYADAAGDACAAIGAKDCQEPSGSVSIGKVITVTLNLLSFAVGIAAVIMIIIGGFKYITASGDSNKLSSAKNTIIFAIVGLVVVALAQFIVQFVLDKATDTSTVHYKATTCDAKHPCHL